jgi:hypothetical protein
MACDLPFPIHSYTPTRRTSLQWYEKTIRTCPVGFSSQILVWEVVLRKWTREVLIKYCLAYGHSSSVWDRNACDQRTIT